ncbi:MAG: radical SAM family heme chaperone HemW [Chitinophagaceae bacterium]|nr:radical SAM family heme chaperone HemW [Chitinophagaceae bacterium]
MAGIYLHIPFCKKACHYCNFHFSTSTRQLPQMVDAIIAEAELRKHYLNDEVNTVYFGGGTPSLLSGEQLSLIMRSLRKWYRISADAEISLEANPDDISIDSLDQWREAGINRLSIGIQSFAGSDLQRMNRAHDAAQSLEALRLAKECGFSNITIDLIYGIPGLSDEQWKENVDTALSFGIPHLSCYALTVEPATALEKMIAQQKERPTDPDQQARQFGLLTEWLGAAGFEHYEISNFAKPGFRSRHNSSYWQGSHYLGLGPSAHSFNGLSRQWNIANNAAYIAGILSGIPGFEMETLSERQRLNEYLMVSLRTMEGISLEELGRRWGNDKAATVVREAQKHLQRNYLVHTGGHLQLTAAGKFLADGIAADLFETGQD